MRGRQVGIVLVSRRGKPYILSDDDGCYCQSISPFALVSSRISSCRNVSTHHDSVTCLPKYYTEHSIDSHRRYEADMIDRFQPTVSGSTQYPNPGKKDSNFHDFIACYSSIVNTTPYQTFRNGIIRSPPQQLQHSIPP